MSKKDGVNAGSVGVMLYVGRNEHTGEQFWKIGEGSRILGRNPGGEFWAQQFAPGGVEFRPTTEREARYFAVLAGAFFFNLLSEKVA